jgi:hypothetical protein
LNLAWSEDGYIGDELFDEGFALGGAASGEDLIDVSCEVVEFEVARCGGRTSEQFG